MIHLRQLVWIALLLLIYPASDIYGQSQDPSTGKISSCNCVAFRLDDVQDYYLNSAQMEIISTFHERNASLTIGVIGNYIGDDASLVSFLKDKTQSNRFSLDVANHGWNHEDFSVLSMEEQSKLLSASNDKIQEHLGKTPTVFITPFNRMNEETLIAMAENELDVVSANVTDVYAPFVRNGTEAARLVYHFPATAKTGDLNSDDTEWVGSSHKATLAEIMASIDTYGYSVVMMHPQEFSLRQGTNFQNSVDADQLAELRLLLDSVRSEGYNIVTLSELPGHATVPEFASYAMLALTISVAILWILRSYGRLRSPLAP